MCLTYQMKNVFHSHSDLLYYLLRGKSATINSTESETLVFFCCKGALGGEQQSQDSVMKLEGKQ